MTYESSPDERSQAIESARATGDFLRDLSRQYLSSTNQFLLPIELPVLPALQEGFLAALERMRSGQPIGGERFENILKEVAESLVDEFEKHYEKVQKQRASAAGVKLPFRVMTRGELEHLRMFVQFLLVRDAQQHYTGSRMVNLEKVHGA